MPQDGLGRRLDLSALSINATEQTEETRQIPIPNAPPIETCIGEKPMEDTGGRGIPVVVARSGEGLLGA
jgi:hypothetical protein